LLLNVWVLQFQVVRFSFNNGAAAKFSGVLSVCVKRGFFVVVIQSGRLPVRDWGGQYKYGYETVTVRDKRQVGGFSATIGRIERVD
jgi:hypothetical protein